MCGCWRGWLYPYLLRNVSIQRPDQAWSTDITYVPLASGFLYLTAILDWYSRYVFAWRLSNTLDGSFCLEMLEEALRRGQPEVFNTDRLRLRDRGASFAPHPPLLAPVEDGGKGLEVAEDIPEHQYQDNGRTPWE